jgi:signal transduction histidine kinase/CheY-like chemotaxis protein
MKKFWGKLIFCLIFVILIAPSVQAKKLDSPLCSQSEISLLPYMEIYNDPQRLLAAQQVLHVPMNNFLLYSDRKLSQQSQYSAFWLRVTLLNRGERACLRWLTVGQRTLNNIQLYIWRHGQWEKKVAGSDYPAGQWSVHLERQPVFPLQLGAGEEITLLIRITGDNIASVKPALWAAHSLLLNREAVYFRDGLILGSVTIIIPLALIIGCYIHSGLLVLLAAAVASSLFLTCVNNGYLVYWPTVMNNIKPILTGAELVTLLSFLGYLAVLLQIKRQNIAVCGAFLIYILICSSVSLSALFDGRLLTQSALTWGLYGLYVLVAIALWAGKRRKIKYNHITWITVFLLAIAFFDGHIFHVNHILWQTRHGALSLASTLPGIFLLVYTLITMIINNRRKQKAAETALDNQIKAEQARLEEMVSQRTLQLKASVDEQTALLARVSHDLRSPLVSMIEYIHSLGEKTHQEEIVKIERNARHQLTLIDELLEFSRSHLTNLEPNLEAGYLYKFLDVLRQEGEFFAREQGNIFNSHFSAELPSLVTTDFIRLRQILMNLLTNAAKFTHNGIIQFVVTSQKIAHETCRLEFKVIDTGIGINPDEITTILQPFHRGSNVENYAGSGLGLSIVAQLLTCLNSGLHIESEAGKGSAFSFVLDVTCPREEDVDECFTESYVVIDEKRVAEASRLLLIDECPRVLEQLQDLLTGYDFDVFTASSYSEALAMLKETTFSLIICEQWVAGSPLTQLLPKIKKRWPALPLILFTQRPLQMPHLMQDINAVILKPADSSELLASINASLR